MVLGAQTTAFAGTVLLLRSPDLVSWSVVGPILTPGAHGYMCECPDLFRIGGSDMLIFCEQHHENDDGGSGFSANVAGAVIGHIDLDSGRFDHGLFHPLDHGRDFHAPQSGWRLLIGWMHCLTIPRELALVGGRLHQRPARELAALRGQESTFEDLVVAGHQWINGIDGAACEIMLRLAPAETGERRCWVWRSPDGPSRRSPPSSTAPASRSSSMAETSFFPPDSAGAGSSAFHAAHSEVPPDSLPSVCCACIAISMMRFRTQHRVGSPAKARHHCRVSGRGGISSGGGSRRSGRMRS